MSVPVYIRSTGYVGVDVGVGVDIDNDIVRFSNNFIDVGSSAGEVVRASRQQTRWKYVYTDVRSSKAVVEFSYVLVYFSSSHRL